METSRPNPDALLSVIQKSAAQAQRGQLRIFFGMCAGVGKTYAMLQAAQEARRNGVKVVVGVVETHGRRETASLLEGLPVIPKKTLHYKGVELSEFDLDQVLALRPQVVLVDELAHTNVPGSRHEKRFQDVEELLAAGIDVYSTMNVQHVESRADLVEQITRLPVRETVPDAILEMAQQIELVDLPPQELLRRLQEGKVYLGERAERAAQNFFKEDTLTALRELSLRFTAEQVEDDLEQQRRLNRASDSRHAQEKLLVAVSHSPYSAHLIRSTKRMAAGMNVDWIALYVDRGHTLSLDDQKTLHRNIELAKDLGAQVITTRDTQLARALRRVAEEHNVTQVVMGRPDRRFIRDLLARGTALDQLVRETSAIDVHVIRQERKPRYRGFYLSLPKMESGFIPYWYTLWAMGLVASGSYVLTPVIGYRAVGFIFLMAVLLISTVAQIGPIFFSAVLSALIWNYFFIPPRFTFVIGETANVMMVSSYFIAALVSGFLTTRIRRQEADLRQREYRSKMLYELGRDFAAAKGESEIASVAVACIKRLFGAQAHVLNPRRESNRRRISLDSPPLTMTEKDYAVAEWSFSHGKRAGWSTDTLASSACLCLPIAGKATAIGVLLYYPGTQKFFSLEQEILLESIVHHLAIALERDAFESQARQATLLEQSERLHQTIINSVSHELRTPLTSILGVSTALQDPQTAGQAETRDGLLQELVESSERLNRVVENLLDMSRLNSGVLKLKRELFELGDLARTSVQKLPRALKNRPWRYDFQPAEIFADGDCALLEHAVLNLLTNAATYSDPGAPIEIATRTSGDRAVLLIKDLGAGIPKEHLEHVFDKFYRLPGARPGGAGLGLSIVKGIIEAHGGTVRAENRSEGKGSVFVVELSLAKPPPPLAENRS